MFPPEGTLFPAGLEAVPFPSTSRAKGPLAEAGLVQATPLQPAVWDGTASFWVRPQRWLVTALPRNPVCSGIPRALGLDRNQLPLSRGPHLGGREVPPPQMASVSTRDLLQELDCLTTKAGQACVQHEGDQRDDCIHVGPGERQGGRGQRPVSGVACSALWPGHLLPPLPPFTSLRGRPAAPRLGSPSLSRPSSGALVPRPETPVMASVPREAAWLQHRVPWPS